MSVVIETTLGDITVDLFLYDRPRACLNFLKLCKIKYYNYNLFHTISRGFIAQTGDPTGTRSGGDSIYGVIGGPSKRYFEAENEPRIKHTRTGLISFVGDENKMIASQFFLTLGEDLTYLDDKHCVFGEVVEGFETLETINEVICDNDDRPYQDVRITHTVILDDPYPDPKSLEIPSRSPSPSAERLAGGRIAPDEEIDETAGKNAKEIAELQAEREAKARATILEMVGDIPDAEMAPPENVLFVCKLNPVTNDDDLEIIFSRFGKIKSCEVIRDRKSGDSLQYAFIEFEERKACEDAYFKMDNVLVDERRIHVDFSQSVSKVKWLGKGRGVAHFDDKGNKKKDDVYNDIGKGKYKVGDESKEKNHAKTNGKPSKSPRQNRDSSDRDYRKRSRSPTRDRYRNNRESYRRRSRSPGRFRLTDRRNDRQSESPRQNRARSNREIKRSFSRSPIRSRNSSYRGKEKYANESPRRNKDSNNRESSRRSRSPRADKIRNSKDVSSPQGKRSNSRRQSRSPISSSQRRSSSKDRSRSPRRNENSERRNREKPLSNEKKSRSSFPELKSHSHLDELSNLEKNKLDKNNKKIGRSPSKSKVTESSSRKKSSKSLPPSKNKTKLELHRKQKSKKYDSSDQSDAESEVNTKKKKKAYKKVDLSESSSEDSTSSSEEEIKKWKKRSKKNKTLKSKRTKRRRKSSTSSSDSSSDSESSSSSSTSDSSSHKKKKSSKRKKSKKTRSTSSSSSDSD